jgi:hypothetical protein
VISFFVMHKQEEQSLTWVMGKETNGKLWWRLLPLHVAIIFGCPLKLVELLLVDYPTAVHSKDDQGMLQFHLAFRNKLSRDIVEELLTASLRMSPFIRPNGSKSLLDQLASASIS